MRLNFQRLDQPSQYFGRHEPGVVQAHLHADTRHSRQICLGVRQIGGSHGTLSTLGIFQDVLPRNAQALTCCDETLRVAEEELKAVA